MSLHYLVKWPCTKIATELNVLPCKSQPFETAAKNIRPVTLVWFDELRKRFKKDVVTKHLHTWWTWTHSISWQAAVLNNTRVWRTCQCQTVTDAYWLSYCDAITTVPAHHLFIFQFDSAAAHRALETVNFLTHNFDKCWPMFRILCF